MRARLMVSLSAVALLGCHTIDAIHNLARPSPITAVSVEPYRGRVAWHAEYREPPGGPDDFMHGIFVRGVTKRGDLDLDPVETCVASEPSGDPVPLRERTMMLVAHPYVRAGSSVHPHHVPSSCEHELRLRLSDTSPYAEAEAIIVTSSSGEPLSEFELPTERPALDPRRWGWLVVAPVLDAFTIAAGVPVFLGLAIAEIVD